ncbi:MAG: TonB-dependent receptor [Bryobacteraceae bacterium]|nr:TonB-dependent receptor [Bryobacteraceae bacterium]MDW8378455.1 carboxypeptidase regulatory-like domain-containing protein [Bryobacterales bacterium]
MQTFVVLVLMFPCLVMAQERTGSLSGRVLDASGGVIAGVEVKLRNVLTGWEREPVRTGEDGVYQFLFVPVGQYQLTARKAGFQATVQEGIHVGVNQAARVDVTLNVAATEQSVTVTADAPQVNTQNAVGGVTIERRAITELPLNGRNFIQLGTLVPGVIQVPSRYEVQGLAPARNGFAVNGLRTQSNNFLLDGVTNHDANFNGYVLTPPPDALEQFKIITSNFSAEYGQQAGSVVTAITRAGTNQYHGALWNFLRNDVFDAREFFATTRPPLRQNQFGGTLGGRIARDRTFFFGYYEGLRARTGTVQNVVVLTEAQRQGNLAGVAPPPVDPLAGNQPFAGGVIPTSRIDPISRTLLERFVPLPNFGPNRFNRAPAIATDGNQFGIRGDHRVSDRNFWFARYSNNRSKTRNPLGGGSFSPAGSNSEEQAHSAVLSNTHTFSTNRINEASLGFLRLFGRPATWSGEDLTQYGWRYTATEPTARGLPIVSLSGLFSIGDVAQSWTQLARNTYQAFDNFSWIRGRHTIKFGGDYRLQQIYLVFPNRPNGDFSFAGNFSRNVIADFLLGLPSQFRQGGGQPAKHFVGHNAGFYFQDDWKATARLTLNLGLRYELPWPYFDKQDRMALFQPGRQSTVRPTAPPGLLFPGDAGVPRATIATDTNNFAPRFGFAYDVTGNGRMSLRGGYGIYYDAAPGLAVFQNINVPPFNRFIQIDGPPSFANPYQNFAINPQVDPSRDFPCPCLVIGFSPDFRTAYAQQFHFTIQRQVRSNWLAEVAYVGSLGRKLGGYLEVNPAVPGPGATLQNTQQRRLYRDYNLVRPTFSRFNSHYHALQARVEKRYSAGLWFQLSYTWGKVIDYQSSINFAGETRPQDAFSLRDVRGLAAFDVRHRMVAYYGYELPWLRQPRSLLSRALGGWQLQGIVSAQTGGPLTVTESVDLSLRGLNADRPDQIRNPNRGPRTVQQWFDTSAFVRLPAIPGGQRSGTAGRNTVIGPGLLQTDLAVLKRIALAESHRFEFRLEAFNAFNRANFRDPATVITQPATFGVIQTSRPARILQFALKYEF